MKKTLGFLLFSVWLFAALLVRGDEKDYHDQDLSKKDFSNASLNGANFSDAIQTEARFDKASLKKSNFKWAAFHHADLTEADLRETTGLAHFSDAILNKANFEGLTFQLAWACKYRGANLKKCKISGLADHYMDFSGADLRGSNLRGVSEITLNPLEGRNL